MMRNAIQNMCCVVFTMFFMIGMFWSPSLVFAASSKPSPVSAGGGHTCVIVNSDVFCTGDNTYSQLADGGSSSVQSGFVQAYVMYDLGGAGEWNKLSNVANISSGENHSCAVDKKGTVYCWGDGSVGQTGNGVFIPTYAAQVYFDVPQFFGKLTSVGTQHSCVVSKQGAVYCWGDNTSGQLGNDSISGNSDNPVIVKTNTGNLSNITQISAGNNHTCALTKTGLVHCWGDNDYGQLGDDNINTDSYRAVPVVTEDGSTLSNISSISAGYDFTCALDKKGAVYCWGDSSNGQYTDVANSTPGKYDRARLVIAATYGVTQLSVGGLHGCVLRKDKKVYCWGDNEFGQLGVSGTDSSQSVNNPVTTTNELTALTNVTNIEMGRYHGCATTSTKNLYCWGRNQHMQLGDGGSSAQRSVSIRPQFRYSTPLTNMKSVSTGKTWSCGLSKKGGVYCWGDNEFGQLGDKSITDRTGAVQVTTQGVALSGVSDLASAVSGFHSCAATKKGEVYCWGKNVDGQLGDGTDHNSNYAVRVTMQNGSLLSNITKVATGTNHSCAINKQKQVFCWGNNEFGQLGSGDTTNQLRAVPVLNLFAGGVPLQGAVSISAGHNFSCATLDTKKAFCWGSNEYGQLGGWSDESFVPYAGQVLSLSGFTSISAGYQHACAIDTFGFVYCWGRNNSYQLGNESNTDEVNGPVWTGMQYGFYIEPRFTFVSAGYTHTCVLYGTLGAACWGDNSYGKTGIGNDSDSVTISIFEFFEVDVSAKLTSVMAGFNHTCLTTSKGNIACLGDNQHGQLGNNSTNSLLFPEMVRSNSILYVTNVQ